MWSGTGGCAWVLEDAKVDRLLMWLDAPRDGVSCRDVDPANEVRLSELAIFGSAEGLCTLLWISMFSMPAMVAARLSSCEFQAYVELFGLVRGVLAGGGRKDTMVHQNREKVGLNSNNVLQRADIADEQKNRRWIAAPRRPGNFRW
jgi:hypothetical protein